MADGSYKAPTWRKNGVDMNDMVPADTAAVLMLHHLKIAAAYFGAMDLEPEPHEQDGDGELIDPLSFHLRSNLERFRLVMRHLDRLHPEGPGNEDYRVAAEMFMIAINQYWDDVWRKEFGPDVVGDDKS